MINYKYTKIKPMSKVTKGALKNSILRHVGGNIKNA